MKRNDRPWVSNIVLLVLSAILSVSIGEAIVRFIAYIDSPPQRGAFLVSSEAFQLDPAGAVRYLPHQTIRSVAVYSPGGVEVDVQFRTNNLGFVDDEDYYFNGTAKRKHYAFVGDSFTAGIHGGEPWVPNLRKHLTGSDIMIYNLGIEGTGIQHFHRLLNSAKAQLEFRIIVILAISNNLLRGFWYPLTSATEIRFCAENMAESECNKKLPIAKVIKISSSHKEILRVADQIFAERKDIDAFRGRFNLKDSKLLAMFHKVFEKLWRADTRETVGSKRVLQSLIALKQIRNDFASAEIHFIHLPEKSEVKKGGYLLDVGEEIQRMQVRYYPALMRCKWSTQMYFVHDAHPNNLGYDNIRKCVSRYLFNQ